MTTEAWARGADGVAQVLERIRQKEGYAGWLGTAGAGKTNALELAILGKARGFIKSQVSWVHAGVWGLELKCQMAC